LKKISTLKTLPFWGVPGGGLSNRALSVHPPPLCPVDEQFSVIHTARYKTLLTPHHTPSMMFLWISSCPFFSLSISAHVSL